MRSVTVLMPALSVPEPSPPRNHDARRPPAWRYPAASASAHCVLDRVGVELPAAARAAEEVGAAVVLAAEADTGHVDDHAAHGIARLVDRRGRRHRRAELACRLQRDELGE